LIQLADRGQSFRFLLHDRDGKFSGGFDEIFRSEGMRIVRMPIRAPNANAHAERWVGTLRRECLDRLLIVSRRQLEHVLAFTPAITTGTGDTEHSRSNRPTPPQRYPCTHRHGRSVNTNCSAASSTNTEQPHERSPLRP
jgi:putative transposase